uniref:Uncharacterized protein n=1 Tax=Sphaerodactylus townsendi TaxID=933632 RepID=A0ACB8G5N4_9SAUR
MRAVGPTFSALLFNLNNQNQISSNNFQQILLKEKKWKDHNGKEKAQGIKPDPSFGTGKAQALRAAAHGGIFKPLPLCITEGRGSTPTSE